MAGVIEGFVQACREAGIKVTTDRVAGLLRALEALGPQRLYWAGRITLCSGRDDIARYDRLLADAVEPETTVSASVVRASQEQGLRATPDEVLRRRDYASLTDGEKARAHTLFLPPRPQRPSRRRAPGHRGRVDARRTTRGMLATLGEPALLRYHRKRPKPRKLVLLVDISGSMTPYADALLHLAHAAVRRNPATTEVFTIATRLTRITGSLRKADMDVAVSKAVPDWRGGTRLGEAVMVYLRRFGHRGMARRAKVVVFSDGWERGDAGQLGDAMAWLSRLADTVTWVTPHAGREGFAPATQGLRAVLPHVNEIVAGHSIATMQKALT
jgi:uncharacterized protein with von Willebrand factor type A (vWA) domain